MKAPYLMSRDEWSKEREALRVQGSFLSKANKASISAEVYRINKLMELFFNVQHWLHEKAVGGDVNALEMIVYGYDAYEQIITKAKEEKLI
jgi:hypothetical protein